MLHNRNPYLVFPAVNQVIAEPRPVLRMLTNDVVILIPALAG